MGDALLRQNFVSVFAVIRYFCSAVPRRSFPPSFFDCFSLAAHPFPLFLSHLSFEFLLFVNLSEFSAISAATSPAASAPFIFVCHPTELIRKAF